MANIHHPQNTTCMGTKNINNNDNNNNNNNNYKIYGSQTPTMLQ